MCTFFSKVVGMFYEHHAMLHQRDYLTTWGVSRLREDMYKVYVSLLDYLYCYIIYTGSQSYVSVIIWWLSNHFFICYGNISTDCWQHWEPTRFEVTMKVAPLVHVSKSLKYLKAPVADFRLWERLDPIFHKLVEITLLEKQGFRFNKSTIMAQ